MGLEGAEYGDESGKSGGGEGRCTAADLLARPLGVFLALSFPIGAGLLPIVTLSAF